jgi:hypothetical protein
MPSLDFETFGNQNILLKWFLTNSFCSWTEYPKKAAVCQFCNKHTLIFNKTLLFSEILLSMAGINTPVSQPIRHNLPNIIQNNPPICRGTIATVAELMRHFLSCHWNTVEGLSLIAAQ